jgi:hypothetical protein
VEGAGGNRAGRSEGSSPSPDRARLLASRATRRIPDSSESKGGTTSTLPDGSERNARCCSGVAASKALGTCPAARIRCSSLAVSASCPKMTSRSGRAELTIICASTKVTTRTLGPRRSSAIATASSRFPALPAKRISGVRPGGDTARAPSAELAPLAAVLAKLLTKSDTQVGEGKGPRWRVALGPRTESWTDGGGLSGVRPVPS